MDDLEEMTLRLGDRRRKIVRRKRVLPRGGLMTTPRVPERRYILKPDGVMWPTKDYEANQYSPAGEVLAISRFFQGLKRRWG